MKTLGIIGGIAPESTIEYYRLIIGSYRDLTKMLDLIGANRLAEVTDYLLAEVGKLARAGADLGLLAANTPHIVFEDIQRDSPIPLVSIVESACAAAKALGLNRVGLLGTRFTMQGPFYSEVFSRLAIVDRLKEKTNIQGVILAGTELPLLLRDVADRDIPLLDTTRIHAEYAVAQMLS